MEKKHNIKAITLGGILSAVYFITTLLSVYVMPILSIFGLLIFPIFAAYYASIFSFKHILIFNITTLILCFFGGIGDPYFCLLYIAPTLIVGDLFGLFIHLKIKVYTTLFLQSIVYSITNILTFYLAEWLYEFRFIDFFFSDQWVYENLSLTFLFLLSGAEAIFSFLFINEQFKKIKPMREKEKKFPIYGNISYVFLFLFSILFYFVSYNVYFLIISMLYILSIPLIFEISKKMKHFNLGLMLYILLFSSLNFYLCYLNLFYIIPLVILIPFCIYCIVKIIVYIYNITNP